MIGRILPFPFSVQDGTTPQLIWVLALSPQPHMVYIVARLEVSWMWSTLCKSHPSHEQAAMSAANNCVGHDDHWYRSLYERGEMLCTFRSLATESPSKYHYVSSNVATTLEVTSRYIVAYPGFSRGNCIVASTTQAVLNVLRFNVGIVCEYVGASHQSAASGLSTCSSASAHVTRYMYQKAFFDVHYSFHAVRQLISEYGVYSLCILVFHALT